VVLNLAQAPLAHAQATNTVGSIQDNITWVMTLALNVMQTLTWVLFGYLNYLLDPRFFLNLGNDGAGNAVSPLLDTLNTIWQLSRDLMNVIFAVGLVFTAVYTVVTAKKDFIAQHAKSFVMAVVLVNFSWFVPQVLLDISNVATATIYGIPSLISDDNCETADGNACVVVTDVKFLNDDATVATLRGEGWTCRLSGFVCTKTKPLDVNTTSSQTTILSGLVVNHGHLMQLAEISRPIQATGARASRELLVFFMREMLILVIAIALFFPLLAMVVAFFVRIPVLWVTMAFMPFALLDWIIPNERIHQGIPAKIRDEFIKAAFLPAFVAVPLTVGFILVNAGAKLQGGGLEDVPFPLMDQVHNFWELLWLLISLSVLYTGVFSVLKKQDGILSTGASAIEGFGKQLGSLALSIPLSKEIIPLPANARGERVSPLQAMNQFNPGRILSELRRTGSITEALSGSGAGNPLAREIDATAGMLRANNADLRALNNRVDALRRADDANFSRAANEVMTELRRINPRLNVNDNRALADALSQLSSRTGRDLSVSNDLITRLQRAPVAPVTPPTPPT
jgi:hypothetical protein